MRFAFRSKFVLVLLFAGGMIGCGAKRVPVSGHVTLQDKPLANAFVVFEPIHGTPDQVSKAQTDDEGHFSMASVNGKEGCIVGEHRVRITTVPPDAVADERSPLPKDKVPERYRREPMVFDVPTDGTEAADFHLQKK